jgi:hypothetical protein
VLFLADFFLHKQKEIRRAGKARNTQVRKKKAEVRRNTTQAIATSLESGKGKGRPKISSAAIPAE